MGDLLRKTFCMTMPDKNLFLLLQGRLARQCPQNFWSWVLAQYALARNKRPDAHELCACPAHTDTHTSVALGTRNCSCPCSGRCCSCVVFVLLVVVVVVSVLVVIIILVVVAAGPVSLVGIVVVHFTKHVVLFSFVSAASPARPPPHSSLTSHTHKLTHAPAHPLIQSHSHTQTHSPTQSLTPSLTLTHAHELTHSLTHPFIQIHSLTHSPTHPCTHSVTHRHTLTPTPTHSHTIPPTYFTHSQSLQKNTHSLTSFTNSLTQAPTHSLTD